MDREEEGTDTDTDINYNIIVHNVFESLRSDPEEPPEVTPEIIVQLRPDHPSSPSTPTTTEMDEMSKIFFKELSEVFNKTFSSLSSEQLYDYYLCYGDLSSITSKYHKHDLFKAWQSAVNNILSRNVDWRDWRGLSMVEPYYKVVKDELMNSIMELGVSEYFYHYQFNKAGYNTLDTFIKQYFRKSQDASELVPTREDEA